MNSTSARLGRAMIWVLFLLALLLVAGGSAVARGAPGSEARAGRPTNTLDLS